MSNVRRQKVYQAIDKERAYQEIRWANPKSSVAEYLLYMEHYLNKAKSAISTEEPVELCNTTNTAIRKLAALAVACGEEHGMCPRVVQNTSVFASGDLLITDDGIPLQCICADFRVAVLTNIILSEDNQLNINIKGLQVIDNNNVQFKYKEATLEQIAQVLTKEKQEAEKNDRNVSDSEGAVQKVADNGEAKSDKKPKKIS